MTNKELQELLKQYPDEKIIVGVTYSYIEGELIQCARVDMKLSPRTKDYLILEWYE